MEETAPPPSRFAEFLNAMKQPKVLGSIALGLALGGAGTAVAYQVWLKPLRAIAERRYGTQEALMRLYDLQLAYRASHGAFANDLETLVGSAPDAEKVRAKLRANADYSTLVVKGDAEKFRLEANVLDPQRTIIRFRGPFGAAAAPSRPEPEALPEPIQSP
jgi:hypothetical protein